MTTTDRPRKRHAAHRSRWASAGLAAASTIGITGYLQLAQPVTTVDTAVPTSNAAGTIDTPPAAAFVPAPAAPITKIVVAQPQPQPSVSVPSPSASPRPVLAAPVVKAPVVRAPVVAAPVVRAPVIHATTRGSGG